MVLADDLGHTALGRKIAVQYGQPTFGLERLVEGADHFLTGLFFGFLRFFKKSFAAGSGRVLDQAGRLHIAGEKAASPGSLEIGGDETAERLDVDNHGRAPGDGVEVAYLELDAGFTRNREQM